jgi:phage terminase large subunit-like protein
MLQRLPETRSWRKVAPEKWTTGDEVCGFIETYCLVPEGKLVGKPMRLEPFQRKFIYDVFDNPYGTRRAILSMARKNGKTSLIAALLLCFVAGPLSVRNAQIVSGAMSKDQAAIIFSLAAKMVRMSPELSRLIRIIPSPKRLVGLVRNVEYQAVSAEAKTAHGKSPLVAILDELGQVEGPTSPFVEAIVTSQGAYEAPLLIAISTQAPTDADLLSIWIDDALRGEDPYTVCHLHAAPADCALDDEAAWAAANPGLGSIRSRKDLAQQIEQASRLPAYENSVRNLLLNQRVQRMAPFLSPAVWKLGEKAVKNELFRPGRRICGGLDLSKRTDLSALVLATEDDDGLVHLLPTVWTPADTLLARGQRDRAPYGAWAKEGFFTTVPGKVLDYDFLAVRTGELAGAMDIERIAYDRWNIDVFKQALAREGVIVEMMPFGQGFRDMTPALAIFEELAIAGRLVHGGHPILRWCISNAVVERDAADNRKLTKAKSFGRIDVAVAAIMAVAALKLQTELGLDIATVVF